MNLAKNVWTEIATTSGCVIVKQSVYSLQICFKNTEPTDSDPSFSLDRNEPLQLPRMDRNVWVKANEEAQNIVVGFIYSI
jgi:hypothetical protein